MPGGHRIRKNYTEASPPVVVLIVKGTMMSLLVSLVFAVCLTMFSLAADITAVDKYFQWIMAGVALLSIFIGSVYATQQAENMALIVGIGVGVLYVLVSTGIGLKLTGETLAGWSFVQKLLAGTAAGVLGGIIGVNL